MRTLILLVLIGVLVFLALDSADKPVQTYEGQIITHYNGWKVRMFGTSLPAEAFVLALMVAVLLVFPRHPRKTAAANPRDTAEDLDAMRDVNNILEQMERRIESLETILLAPEARLKTPLDMTGAGRRLDL
jgi:hypothetical protein